MARTAGPRLPETFARKLSALFASTVRTATGDPWTNTTLAEAVTEIGVPVVQSYISQLRHGKRTNPSADLVGAIASAFGVPVGYFYDGEEATQRQIDEQRTVNALRAAGVENVAWRASGISAQGLEQLAKLADYIRAMEGLPPAE
ncbi:helix-turn-helix domain-containing protein [Nakamurella panacisegetis]|nr:helix-turn-helix transcriptional regulator [Nakamurella panacisegetis]